MRVFLHFYTFILLYFKTVCSLLYVWTHIHILVLLSVSLLSLSLTMIIVFLGGILWLWQNTIFKGGPGYASGRFQGGTYRLGGTPILEND